MEDRFKVVEGSQSGHDCCYKYTVVDTTKPEKYGAPGEFEGVCELVEKETANWVCDALNRTDRMEKTL